MGFRTVGTRLIVPNNDPLFGDVVLDAGSGMLLTVDEQRIQYDAVQSGRPLNLVHYAPETPLTARTIRTWINPSFTQRAFLSILEAHITDAPGATVDGLNHLQLDFAGLTNGSLNIPLSQSGTNRFTNQFESIVAEQAATSGSNFNGGKWYDGAVIVPTADYEVQAVRLEITPDTLLPSPYFVRIYNDAFDVLAETSYNVWPTPLGVAASHTHVFPIEITLEQNETYYVLCVAPNQFGQSEQADHQWMAHLPSAQNLNGLSRCDHARSTGSGQLVSNPSINVSRHPPLALIGKPLGVVIEGQTITLASSIVGAPNAADVGGRLNFSAILTPDI